MSRLKWSGRYNCHTFSLAPGLGLGINWSVRQGKQWEATVFGQKFPADFDDFAEAEKAVIYKAMQVLRTALDRLEKVEL